MAAGGWEEIFEKGRRQGINPEVPCAGNNQRANDDVMGGRGP